MKIKDIMTVTGLSRNGAITFAQRAKIPYRSRTVRGGQMKIYDITEEEVLEIRRKESEKPRGAPLINKFDDSAVSQLLGSMTPILPDGKRAYHNPGIWDK